MIALFFEVTPRPGQDDRYLEIAGGLKPELEASGGVAYLDRFRSLSRPRTMLSHQLWADEASLARWRANGRHYGAQTAGRREVFEDYRLRVGAVAADMAGRLVAKLEPGLTYNDTARTPERWMIVVRSEGALFHPDGIAGEGWRSVYNDKAYAFVADVAGREVGEGLMAMADQDPCVSAAHLVLVSRDYGMFARGEAPQYFPQTKGA
ncbi:MAG: antibiotic biosynthesis monooxygenase family protein [Hyphomicrobiaceae bacterium]